MYKPKIIWHTEKRKISELFPAPYNPRELTEKQARDLSTSMMYVAGKVEFPRLTA